MISKQFREKARSKGFSITADKVFPVDKRFSVTIKESSSGNKAKFAILHSFGIVDVSCFTDVIGYSPEFKVMALEMIEHITQECRAKAVMSTLHCVLNQHEVVEWKAMEGFSEFSALFKDATLWEEAPFKVYDPRALYDRIELNKTLELELDNSPLKGRYKTNNHLGEIKIWWKYDEHRFGELRIGAQDVYYVRVNHSRDSVKVDDIDTLRSLVKDVANDRSAKWVDKASNVRTP